MHCILEVSGSNLVPITGCPDFHLSWSPSVFPHTCWYSISNYITAISFHNKLIILALGALFSE